jgi:hypothetical protein
MAEIKFITFIKSITKSNEVSVLYLFLEGWEVSTKKQVMKKTEQKN